MSDNNDDIRITKELREWAKKPIPVLYGSSVSVFSVVTPIADRIEAEVAQLRQQLIEFMQTNAEWAKKYEDYIELPRAANGRVIRLGDKLFVDSDPEKPICANAIAIYDSGTYKVRWDGNSMYFDTDKLIHAEDYKEPDTIEKFLDDYRAFVKRIAPELKELCIRITDLTVEVFSKPEYMALLELTERLGWAGDDNA